MDAKVNKSRHMRRIAVCGLMLAAVAVGTSALADKDKKEFKQRGGKSWHDDISRFLEQDWPLWRAGHWTHGRHDGRMGWWWGQPGIFTPRRCIPTPIRGSRPWSCRWPQVAVHHPHRLRSTGIFALTATITAPTFPPASAVGCRCRRNRAKSAAPVQRAAAEGGLLSS